jgi:hypothetical protein
MHLLDELRPRLELRLHSVADPFGIDAGRDRQYGGTPYTVLMPAIAAVELQAGRTRSGCS